MGGWMPGAVRDALLSPRHNSATNVTHYNTPIFITQGTERLRLSVPTTQILTLIFKLLTDTPAIYEGYCDVKTQFS
jgi:hypothetical protein